MERIQSINPERIKWCCVEHNMTPAELAAELDISAASMDRVMGGMDAMTFNQLRKVAEYFGRGVLFFLETGQVDEAKVHSAQFRTLANQKPELSDKLKALIERVEHQRAIYLSLREDLDDPDRPWYRPPEFSTADLRSAAKITRHWLGLRDQNNFETYRTAVEAQGV